MALLHSAFDVVPRAVILTTFFAGMAARPGKPWGRPPDTFYMLLAGVVNTAGEADVQYGPGAAFDVVAMAERSPARATITADGPLRMLVMSHAQFRAVAALPRLQDALWRVTSPAAVAPPLQPRHPARARM